MRMEIDMSVEENEGEDATPEGCLILAAALTVSVAVVVGSVGVGLMFGAAYGCLTFAGALVLFTLAMLALAKALAKARKKAEKGPSQLDIPYWAASYGEAIDPRFAAVAEELAAKKERGGEDGE